MPELDYRQKAWSIGLIVLFFAGWELFCLLTGMSDLVLPRPSQIIATLIDKFPLLWPHILQTLATTMIGFVLGVVLGVVLGAIIGVSKTAYDTAYPLLVGFSSIPKVALVPIFVLWFGAGTTPAILTSMVICVFPIVVNVATGKIQEVPLSDYPADDRLVVRVGWRPSPANQVVFQIQNRIQTKLDVCEFDTDTKKLRKLVQETSPAWVDVIEEPKWLPDGGFLWLSDSSGGRRHLVRIDADGKRNAVTQGDWDVID